MANFYQFAPTLLNFEGGYVNDPLDRGGATNKGITIATMEKYGKDLDGDGDIDVEDLKLLSVEDALEMYKERYWDRIKGDQITNQEVANIVFDMGVNSGTGTATKKLQQQLNKQGFALAVDGGFGPKTLAATNAADQDLLFNDFWDARKQFYLDIVKRDPSQKRFINGWLNRLNKFVKKKAQS